MSLRPDDKALAAYLLRERVVPRVELQVALELHYWEDLSGPELAAVLEIPEGTVRSRLRRGRELLQEAFARVAAEAHGTPPRASTSSICGPSAFGTPWAADRVNPAGLPCFVWFLDDLAGRARWS